MKGVDGTACSLERSAMVDFVFLTDVTPVTGASVVATTMVLTEGGHPSNLSRVRERDVDLSVLPSPYSSMVWEVVERNGGREVDVVDTFLDLLYRSITGPVVAKESDSGKGS